MHSFEETRAINKMQQTAHRKHRLKMMAGGGGQKKLSKEKKQ